MHIHSIVAVLDKVLNKEISLNLMFSSICLFHVNRDPFVKIASPF